MADPASALPTPQAQITLREITQATLHAILDLTVAPQQTHFVASNAVSIAEAHFAPEMAWFRAVYADDIPVGFVMLAEDPIKQEYHLWRFMIDARFQGCGFGKRALELVFEHVRRRPGATAILTSCVPGEGSPGPFYEKLGFRYTGEEEDGERVMRRAL
jgi:diamine N-acetyltransferase